MNIVKATTQHAHDIGRLFDLYRQFYDCAPDLELATRYIDERLGNGESDIFVAYHKNKACGFAQLYPSFCSIEAAKIYVLYDLYVDASYRKSGFGEALMNQATQWAKQNGAVRLDLLTDKTNYAGQHLYEKLGYKKTLQDFYAYSLDIK